MRLLAASLMVACSVSPVGLAASLSWGVVYAVVQALEIWFFWTKRPIFADLAAPKATAAFLAILLANSVVFGAAGDLAILRLGGWGAAFACLVVSGGMLHTVITTVSAPRAFRVSIIPYMLHLAGMVVAVGVQGARMSVLASVGFGSVLLCLTAIKLWRHATLIQRRQQETTEALEEALRQAQVANRAKSAFLATMSHEIRTPLNGVLGMAQAMSKDPLSPSQADRLDIIQRSGEALLTILNDVLDLSKVEAGSLELEAVEFDLRDLFFSAHAAFSALASQKGLAFGLEIAPESEGCYLGDPTRLRQVLYNLISNAVKFTETGEVGVRVDACAGGIRACVRDTGIGISADHLGQLFRPFAQADTSITRRFGGTGLGLAVAQQLVRNMGGTLEVESALGIGSVFSFTVELPRLSSATPPEEAPEAQDHLLYEEPLRVLAAEDNAVNQLVLRTLLGQAGIDIVLVENGRDAVEAFKGQDWDVVLMDVHMPEMDGISALKAIRRCEAEAGTAIRTPVIMVTADVMSNHTADYFENGADGIVAKPLNALTLMGELDRVLRARDDRAEAALRVA